MSKKTKGVQVSLLSGILASSRKAPSLTLNGEHLMVVWEALAQYIENNEDALDGMDNPEERLVRQQAAARTIQAQIDRMMSELAE